MLNKILAIDHQISEKLRAPADKKLVRSAAIFFAHSGDSWFWIAGLFIIWIFTTGSWHRYAAIFASAILIQASLVIAIKFIIRRQRPEGQWGEIYRKTDPNSFPSGHAVRAMMLAVMTWGFHIEPLKWILFIWAPLVSLARVMLGVHYLIDIIAGWIFGIFIAFMMLFLTPMILQFFPNIF